jgi:hypothetical protein
MPECGVANPTPAQRATMRVMDTIEAIARYDDLLKRILDRHYFIEFYELGSTDHPDRYCQVCKTGWPCADVIDIHDFISAELTNLIPPEDR